MAILLIITDKGEEKISFSLGSSLREILVDKGIPVRSGCGGLGVCGLCRVRIQSGDVTSPTTAELRRLSPEQIGLGTRLACQVKPNGDLCLIMEEMLPRAFERIQTTGQHGKVEAKPLGLAVDLGTTRIRISLRDMASGERLACRIIANPQAVFGSDIMTRLTIACESRQRAGEIGEMTRVAIGEALADIARIEGYSLEAVERVIIVGNSAMLSLLAERNYELLLNPAYWTTAIDFAPEQTGGWLTSWGVSDRATVELVPPLAGFVGSDLLAGVHATRLAEHCVSGMLIDFGTNSEIALWDGSTLWVTSAAGGPAFEGCGISCGMPAEQGAIHRVSQHPDGVHYEVIGDGEAKGVCGSGLVDIIAYLRRRCILNEVGRFSIPTKKGFVFRHTKLTVTKRDIDAFQRAKAAIGAGVQTLLGMAGLRSEELRRIYICGAFGSYLETKNALEIGLLPRIDPDRVKLYGDSALDGCERLLFSTNLLEDLNYLRKAARIINLAQVPEFEKLFIENLYLRPMSACA